MPRPSILPRTAFAVALTLAISACQTSSSPNSPSPANAAALSGTWTGTLTQPNGPLADVFAFTLVLSQSGSTLTGRSRVEVRTGSPRYFAEYAVAGNITGDRADIVEGGIVSELSPPGGAWCMKTHALTVDASRKTLTGGWTAPGCLPGQVQVSR